MLNNNDQGDQKSSYRQAFTPTSKPHDGTNAKPSITKFTAYLMVFMAYTVGSVSMLVFVVFLFKGSLNLVPLGLTETGAVALNTFLSLIFFVQHSTMIRTPFRLWLARFIGPHYHGTLFAIVSGVFLLLLVIFWQKSTYTVVTLNTGSRLLLRCVFFLSFGGFYWSARALNSFDTFGITPVLRNLRGMDPPQSMPFVVRGPYRYLRHPIYFFSLLLIWSCPDLSADRLLFNILWTVWIIVGTLLEERDLVDNFGADYKDYQRKVPMLIPWRIHPAQ